MKLYYEIYNIIRIMSKQQITKIINLFVSSIEETCTNNEYDINDFDIAENKEIIKQLKKILKTKKSKKKKTGPKAPGSKYLIYCNRIHSEIKEEMPELKSTDVMKEKGRRWKELKQRVEDGDEEAIEIMDSLDEEFNEKKAKYLEEKEKLKLSSSESSNSSDESSGSEEKKTNKKNSKKSKKSKKTNRKKHTAWSLFRKDKAAELKGEYADDEDVSNSEIQEKVREEWQTLKKLRDEKDPDAVDEMNELLLRAAELNNPEEE